MDQTINVIRQDGSLDLDFYRARARALRSQAIRDAAALRWGTGLVAFFAIAGLLASVPKSAAQVASLAAPAVACTHSGPAGSATKWC